MRRGITAYGLDRRLSKVELSLGVKETPAMRYGRETLLTWLLNDPNAPDLYVSLESMIEDRGSIAGVCQTKAGRATLDAVISGIYASTEPAPVNTSGTFDA